jgi:hypothetical protein
MPVRNMAQSCNIHIRGAGRGAGIRRQLGSLRSGETLSEFIREAVTSRLDAKARIETRRASLARVLDHADEPMEKDLSATDKVRLQERLRAKHSR